MRWKEDEEEFLKNEGRYLTYEEIADRLERSTGSVDSKVKRMGIDRFNRTATLKKIREKDFTSFDPSDPKGHFVSGLTAGEGSFCVNNRSDRKHNRYTFQMELVRDDRNALELVKDTMGCGKIYDFDSRDKKWQGTSRFIANRVADMVTVVIPFFEAYPLHSTYKQEQFEEWKEALYSEYCLEEAGIISVN